MTELLHRSLASELQELVERLDVVERHRVPASEELIEPLVRVRELSIAYGGEFGRLTDLPRSAHLTLLRAIIEARRAVEVVSEPLRRVELRAAVEIMNTEESHL